MIVEGDFGFSTQDDLIGRNHPLGQDHFVGKAGGHTADLKTITGMDASF